jgi:FdhE protein
MRGDFDGRIARARHLATKFPSSAALLDFYAKLAAFQKKIWLAAASDAGALTKYFPELLALIESSGPDPLKSYAREHLRTSAQREELLGAAWPFDLPDLPEPRFYARTLLQPCAERLATRADLTTAPSTPVCPFCNAKPLLAILRGEGDGAKRSLLCSLCATEWTFRRVFCPNCGEDQKDQLPVYTTDQISHVRVEACDSCRTYLKSINLTKDGFAVPEVDEIATVALDVWADEGGYTKIEQNLLGM